MIAPPAGRAVLPLAAARGPVPRPAASDTARENERIWSRHWVAVGVEDQVPGAGDLLPATLGHHGLHVLRRPDGALDAAFNVMQQGSCWTVPAQCGNGHKIPCAYSACGHSRDPDALSSPTGTPTREMRQFLGINPGRRAAVPLERRGPLLFLSLPVPAAPPLHEQAAACLAAVDDGAFRGRPYLGRGVRELDCSWREATDLVFGAHGAGDGTVVRVGAAAPLGPAVLHRSPPNLALVVGRGHTLVATAKPTGRARCEVLLAVYGDPANGGVLEEVLAGLDARWAAAWGEVTGSPLADWARSRLVAGDGVSR